MIVRRAFIEAVLRQIYNGLPNDDANITYNLVNHYINEAIALQVKTSYFENAQIEGAAYINNAFLLTVNVNSIIEEDNFLYRFSLPDTPVALGRNDGLVSVQFKDIDKNISIEAALLDANQVSYLTRRRPIQNRVTCWSEGNIVFCYSDQPLYSYSAKARMVSGSKDSGNLDAVMYVPDEYVPKIREYVRQQLLVERQQPRDVVNDGEDRP